MEGNRAEIARMRVSDISLLYREGTIDEEVISHSFDQDIFFKSVPDFNPLTANTIIDVGAHLGSFSLKAVTLNPLMKVVAIEASSDNFRLLKQNIEINHLEQTIKALNIALSDKTGEEVLYMSNESWGHSTTRENSSKPETVEALTLEDLFLRNQIESCDLIKFNCEGSEFKILLSTPQELFKKVKMMIVLFHEDLEEQYNRYDLYKVSN